MITVREKTLPRSVTTSRSSWLADLSRSTPPTQFESVVVSGADALVECYACSSITLMHLHYLYDRWWFLGYVAPSSEELLKAANLPQTLVALAHAHVAMTKKSDEPATQCEVFSCYFTSAETYDVRVPAQIAFDSKLPGFVSGVDGYRLTLAFAPSDGGSGAKLANVESRAPTPAESWANPPSVTVTSSSPVPCSRRSRCTYKVARRSTCGFHLCSTRRSRTA